jgi:methylenetetrahydrofolate reductase (NADPH)
MRTLHEKLAQTTDFLVGVEVVSFRGSMSEERAARARRFISQVVQADRVDWISITDNAGGNPQLAPQALGKPALYAGKEVVIHLTCKDLNRNGLESEAWLLNSEGFHNVLAMTGDFPTSGNGGMAKPVFDIDSVALIALLDKMNRGFDASSGRAEFCIGAVASNYKLLEGEVVPQLLKLAKKVECGARFIINQVGYDARKASELRVYMDQRGMRHVPLIGNVYVLNPRVAQIFHDGRIPGIVLTARLLDLCQRQGASPDGGRAFFQELAARQMAIFRGLGYRGAYLGGVHDLEAVERVLEIERTFSPDDWKAFAKEIRFSRPGEYFSYAEDPASGLADPAHPTPPRKPPSAGLHYAMAKWTHGTAFTPGTALARWGARACASATDPSQGPPLLRLVEHVSKAALFRCKDCGDCSLPEIAFLCPESQCAKNQRNGPCGGTRGGRCEVDGYGDCIWLRAYERRRHDGTETDLLRHAPVIQNQRLRGTSAWANAWLGRDHTATTDAAAGHRVKQDAPAGARTEP